MKFIVSKDGVKRTLETPFAMCIDAEEFATLIWALQRAQAGMTAIGSGYGWVRIDTDHPDPDSKPNTAPIPWAQLCAEDRT
jgi:hypothetical protein